jgi:nitrile hydratase
MVAQPRTVLGEMGLDVQEDVRIRVWDSSAEARYLVLPERPAGTDDLDQDALMALVSRDSMIGVGSPLSPDEAADD